MPIKVHLLVIGFVFLVSSAKPQSQEYAPSVIETILGTDPNNVAGTEFSFSMVSGLATDATGNVYFSIQALDRVYRLGVDGHVTGYAGNGVHGKQRDGVLATTSPLLSPAAIAIDASSNLLISSWNSLVRVDGNTGVLSTVFTMPYREPGSTKSIVEVDDMAVGPNGHYTYATGVISASRNILLPPGPSQYLRAMGSQGLLNPACWRHQVP